MRYVVCLSTTNMQWHVKWCHFLLLNILMSVSLLQDISSFLSESYLSSLRMLKNAQAIFQIITHIHFKQAETYSKTFWWGGLSFQLVRCNSRSIFGCIYDAINLNIRFMLLVAAIYRTIGKAKHNYQSRLFIWDRRLQTTLHNTFAAVWFTANFYVWGKSKVVFIGNSFDIYTIDTCLIDDLVTKD